MAIIHKSRSGRIIWHSAGVVYAPPPTKIDRAAGPVYCDAFIVPQGYVVPCDNFVVAMGRTSNVAAGGRTTTVKS